MKNKPNHEPSIEERQRIVADVTNNKLSKDLLPPKPNELEQLLMRRNDAKNKVLTHLKPVIDAAVMLAPTDPNYAHSATGRQALTAQALKGYIATLKEFDKDEVLWLLALEYADRTVERFL